MHAVVGTFPCVLHRGSFVAVRALIRAGSSCAFRNVLDARTLVGTLNAALRVRDGNQGSNKRHAILPPSFCVSLPPSSFLDFFQLVLCPYTYSSMHSP